MVQPSTIDDLLELLQQGNLLVLPNPRAAANLRHAFDIRQQATRQQAEGTTVWQPAQAMAWSQWATGLWNDLVLAGAEPRLLLNPAQEHALWLEIVAEDTSGKLQHSLASLDSLADLASGAWALAASFDALSRLRPFLPGATEDARLFSVWAAEFTRRCNVRGYLSAALLDAALTQHVADGTAPPLASLQLVGFPSFLPSQQSLLNALQARGTITIEHRLTAPPHENAVHASVMVGNPQEELQLAAHWLRSQMEARPSAPPRIAVLVPTLAEDRAGLDAVLRDLLAPELNAIDADLSSTPWEFSSGASLLSIPLLADALDLARWSAAALPLDRITSLLLSPHLGVADDRDLAANFDLQLRRRESLLRPELSLPELVGLLDKHVCALQWPRHLAVERQRIGDLTKPRTFADWMEVTRSLVAAANWPGPRALTASEFESTHAWNSALDVISTLDFSGDRVPFTAALAALERHLRNTSFQPPSTHASIQVMTPAESIGSVFDAVLFLHSTDRNWPPTERPHPLLPWSLQTALEMPGTDPHRSAGIARDFIADILSRSAAALFTFAAEDDDGPLRPSPRLSELGISTQSAVALLTTAPAAPIVCDFVPDDIPLPPLRTHTVPGGATVLRLQAACGFRAFAELRLQSKEPEAFDLGFDAQEKGRQVHQTLQLFWTAVGTQQQLNALPTHELESILRRCIQETLGRHAAQDPWDAAYLTLQQERLYRLLLRWLEAERSRGPFTFLQGEKDELVTVGPLTLEVRIDRIDQIPNQEPAEEPGGFVIVDYKTGRSGHPAEWQGDRPDDPQLPLYALATGVEGLQGLTFAKVFADDMRWLGHQSRPGILPKSRSNELHDDLSSLVEDWRITLDALAQDFAAGRAEVAPKHYPQTCEFCRQRLLCRVNPATLHQPGADGEDIQASDSSQAASGSEALHE
jgi:probable DNA repair protein